MPNLHLCDLDLNKNALLNPVIHPVGTAPSNPVEGQIYYDNTGGDKQIYVYDGSDWVSMGGDITNVIAGDGLQDGGTSGAVTLNIDVSDFVGTGLAANGENIDVAAAQTGITSIINASLTKLGTAANQEYLTFGTSNEVNTFINNTERLSVTASGVDITGALTVSGSYNLASGDIPNNAADTSGEATTATALASGRTIAMTGDVAWTSASFTGAGNVTGTSTIGSAKVHHAMLHDDIISGQAAYTGDIANGDEFAMSDTSDSGEVKKVDFSVVRDAVFNDVSGDGTVAAGGALVITGSDGNFTVGGNLTVSGDTITANVASINVEDKNLMLNYHASSDTSGTANGAGITIQDAVDASNDATMLWTASSDTFTFSHPVNADLTGDVTGDVTGNADTATVLANSRNFRTNLASTAVAGFTGAAACNPGVTGTLATGNGGTGAANLNHLVQIAGSQTVTGTKTLNSFKGTGSVTVTNILNSNSMTGANGTTLTTSGAVKTYVDAKTWNGNDITAGTVVSARLDADTAHLGVTQTFTGAKTFEENISIAGIVLDGNTITGVDDSGEFTDNDAHIMTSAGIKDKFHTLNGDTTGNAATATNLVVSTSSVVALGSINLGHASDTTIARSAAGRVTIEGQQIATSKSYALAHATTGVAGDTGSANGNKVFTITHGMGNSLNYMVQVIAASGGATVFPCVTRTTSTVVITFNAAVAASAYTALLVKI